MEPLDAVTGRPLPSDALQRVLFSCPRVHVYTIPPLTSMQGHKAAGWTEPPSRQIFTGRLRLLETSSLSGGASQFKFDLVLENNDTSELFVAAPFADANVIESATDSSRFFAVTVRDAGTGRKAFLGIGYEDRSDAFDFSVAVQQAYQTLGFLKNQGNSSQGGSAAQEEEKKDYSLKAGETITVNIAGLKGRRQQRQAEGSDDLKAFSLPPPPSSKQAASASLGSFALPPPPSADDVKRKRRSLRDLGFDNGQSGEFE